MTRPNRFFIERWSLIRNDDEYWLEILDYGFDEKTWKYKVSIENTSSAYDSDDWEYIHSGWEIMFYCKTKEEKDIFLKILKTAD